MRGSDVIRTPLVSSRSGLPSGTAGVWTTALATLTVLLMLAALLWIVAVNAFGWFWPARVTELDLADGSTVIGIVVAREERPVENGDRQVVQHRIQLKTGNRELTGADFRWVDESEVLNRSTPSDLVRLVRTEYGDAFGRIIAARSLAGDDIDIGDSGAVADLLAAGAELRAERKRLETRLSDVRHPLTEYRDIDGA